MKVTEVFEQAPTRLKETFALARSLLNDRLPKDRREQTNQKIMASLRKLGVATRSEIVALENRIEVLESQLQSLHAGRPERGIHS